MLLRLLLAMMICAASALSVTAGEHPPAGGGEISLYLRSESDTGTRGDDVTKDAKPLVAGQTKGGARVEVIADGKVVGTAVAYEWGYWQVRLPKLSEGVHVLRARVEIDRRSHVSNSLRLVLDQTPPEPPTIRIVKGYAVNGQSPYRLLPVEGTSEKGTSRIDVYIGGGSIVNPSVRGDGSWSVKVELKPGARTLSAVAFDRAGNRSKHSKPLKVRIIELQDSVDVDRLNGKDGTALWVRGFEGNCFEDSELAAAADVDGDGLGDVLIGGAWADASGDGPQGKVVGVMGSKGPWKAKIDAPALPARAGFEVVGTERNQLQSARVTRAGDINGDGYGDFAVLAHGYRGATENLGLLAVLYGGKSGFPKTVDLAKLRPKDGFRLLGDAEYRGPAAPIEGIGDFNGDGIDDLVFRAYDTLYVLFGKRGERDDLSLKRLGRKDAFQLKLRNASTRVSVGGGDIDGDGLADLVVGVAASGRPGSVNIIFGRDKLPKEVELGEYARTAGVNLKLATDRDWFSVASGFDLNGDRKDDIVALAEGGSFDGADGKGIVIYGNSRRHLQTIDLAKRIGSKTGFRLAGEGDSSWWLQSAAGGDFNDDGLDDLVLGSSNGGKDVGYVVYGRRQRSAETLDPSKLDGIDGYRLTYSGRRPSFDAPGCTVASAGDFNGDGIDDILMSGRSANRIDQPGAAAYVVFGRRE
jgi:hypothetical protein